MQDKKLSQNKFITHISKFKSKRGKGYYIQSQKVNQKSSEYITVSVYTNDNQYKSVYKDIAHWVSPRITSILKTRIKIASGKGFRLIPLIPIINQYSLYTYAIIFEKALDGITSQMLKDVAQVYTYIIKRDFLQESIGVKKHIKLADMLNQTREYGVRWTEFDRNDRLVKKQKIFTSQAQMMSFVKKLEKKDNFNAIDSWLGDAQK